MDTSVRPDDPHLNTGSLIGHKRHTVSEEQTSGDFEASHCRRITLRGLDKYPDLYSPKATDRVKTKDIEDDLSRLT